MSSNILRVLTPLRQALERIDRKARPLLATPELLDTEEGEDLLDGHLEKSTIHLIPA